MKYNINKKMETVGVVVEITLKMHVTNLIVDESKCITYFMADNFDHIVQCFERKKT